ncbi:MAG: 3-dehydroquinate synthase [Acidiferrobacteraceae bacterium]
MRTLSLDLGARSYPIHIGRDLIGRADLVSPARCQRVAVVTDRTVAPLYLAPVLEALKPLRPVPIVLPSGEQHKTLAGLDPIFTALLEAHCDRDTALIALGGGVVGDMTGFAAACYQRGVPFVQIPTTLLAQVDSSVGGKTGVNHALGKNMIGAFHQPEAVIIDTGTLATLPDKELSAGLAEIIKYGLIRDPEFFGWLEVHMEQMLGRDDEILAEAIERSCRHKAIIVSQDEREAGSRALLNLGHTFGHAIETGAGYGTWLHGEAVAAGMMMAADLSRRLGWIDTHDVRRIADLLRRARLPVTPPPIEPGRFLELMAVDKKSRHGRMRLVLLKAIGEAVIADDFPQDALGQTLAQAIS